MSAVIEVTQNSVGHWTAKGQRQGVYAEITCATRQEAVLAITAALHALDGPLETRQQAVERHFGAFGDGQ